jgi:hypothetical protein
MYLAGVLGYSAEASGVAPAVIFAGLTIAPSASDPHWHALAVSYALSISTLASTLGPFVASAIPALNKSSAAYDPTQDLILSPLQSPTTLAISAPSLAGLAAQLFDALNASDPSATGVTTASGPPGLLCALNNAPNATGGDIFFSALEANLAVNISAMYSLDAWAYSGGSIFASGARQMLISSSTFSGATAIGRWLPDAEYQVLVAAALAYSGLATLAVYPNRVQPGQGGALNLASTSRTLLTSSTLTNCATHFGGAVYSYLTPNCPLDSRVYRCAKGFVNAWGPSPRNCTFLNNYAAAAGGDQYSSLGKLDPCDDPATCFGSGSTAGSWGPAWPPPPPPPRCWPAATLWAGARPLTGRCGQLLGT